MDTIDHCGNGYAHDTLVLLDDGTAIPVQNVRVGQWLLSDNGQALKVITVTGGDADLYTIYHTHSPTISYTVTADHQLLLLDRDSVVSMSVRRFINDKTEPFVGFTRRIPQSVPRRVLQISPLRMGSYVASLTNVSTEFDDRVLEKLSKYVSDTVTARELLQGWLRSSAISYDESSFTLDVADPFIDIFARLCTGLGYNVTALRSTASSSTCPRQMCRLTIDSIQKQYISSPIMVSYVGRGRYHAFTCENGSGGVLLGNYVVSTIDTNNTNL